CCHTDAERCAMRALGGPKEVPLFVAGRFPNRKIFRKKNSFFHCRKINSITPTHVTSAAIENTSAIAYPQRCRWSFALARLANRRRSHAAPGPRLTMRWNSPCLWTMITPGELVDVGGAAATCLDGCESNRFMLQCMSLLLALSGHLSCAHRCPLSE